MHLIQCPHCQKKFKVSAPLSNAKLKCSACGQSFVGSSVSAPDAPPAGGRRPAAPGAAQPGAAPQPAQLMYRRGGMSARAKAAMVLVGLVAIICMIAAAVYVQMYPEVDYLDHNTKQHIKQRMSREEFAQLQVRIKKEEETEAAKIAAAAHPTRSRPAPGATGAPGETTTTGPVVFAPPPPQDPKLVPNNPVIDRPMSNRAYVFITGSVKNKYDKTLGELKLEGYFRGEIVVTKVFKYVPPDGLVKFGVAIPVNTEEEIGEKEVDIRFTGTPTNEDVVVLDVPDLGKGTDEGDFAVWAGRVHNTTGSPLTDVRIFCELFNNKLQADTTVEDAVLVGDTKLGKEGAVKIRTKDTIADGVQCRLVGRKY
jgi:predicted Zn finger-like uncharacterized protein